jgi:very-short-patch-repair endonuclease
MAELFNQEKQKERRRLLRSQMPVSEKLFWYKVRRNNLGYRFRRQFGIGKYIVDFYCPQFKLVVEIDGATHETEKELEHDRIRQNFLEGLGLEVKRYDNLQIKNGLGWVIDDLLEFIKRKEKNSPPCEGGARGG